VGNTFFIIDDDLTTNIQRVHFSQAIEL